MSTRRKAPTRRKYGRDRAGRQVFQAILEVLDRDGHVIGIGELFTVAARGTGGTVPVCRDCRPFEVAAS